MHPEMVLAVIPFILRIPGSMYFVFCCSLCLCGRIDLLFPQPRREEPVHVVAMGPGPEHAGGGKEFMHAGEQFVQVF